MSAGRPSTSDAVKRLRGTDQKCRTTGNAIQFEKITKLQNLDKSYSKTTRRLYKEMGAALIVQGILTPTNIYQFVAYCNEMALYIDINKHLSKPTEDGKTELENRIHQMNAETGKYTKVVAMQGIAHRCLQHANKIANEFGFTPASAKKIIATVLPKNDENEDFMKFLKS